MEEDLQKDINQKRSSRQRVHKDVKGILDFKHNIDKKLTINYSKSRIY